MIAAVILVSGLKTRVCFEYSEETSTLSHQVPTAVSLARFLATRDTGYYPLRQH